MPLCRIAALEHENHKNNYALRILPCSATQRPTLCTRKLIRHGYMQTHNDFIDCRHPRQLFLKEKYIIE
jgi:hypothetical protein